MPSTKAPLGSLDETRLRKIALLIYSVDANAAQQLMMQLPSETAAEVRAIMATLSQPESTEQQRLFEEIQQLAESVSATMQSRHSASDFGDARRTANCPDRPTNAPFWSDQNAKNIADILARERPPVIAAIISRLPADKCIELLRTFTPDLSSQIVGCISNLGELNPEFESEIDDYLASKSGSQPCKREPEDSRRLSQLSAILKAAPEELQQQWRKALKHEPQIGRDTLADKQPTSEAAQLDHPELNANSPDLTQAESEPYAVDGEPEDRISVPLQAIPTPNVCNSLTELAEEPADRLELLLELTDTDLVSLFDRAEPETLVVALAGAEPDLIKRLAVVLDSERLSAIDEGMRQLEHLQLGDIDEAQERLLVLAQQMSSNRRLAS